MIAVGVAYADLKSDVKNANATVADLAASKASDQHREYYGRRLGEDAAGDLACRLFEGQGV